MQVKVFAAFSEFEVRLELENWLKANRDAQIFEQKTLGAVDGLGVFEGKSVYQIVITYEQKKRKRA